ncbi:vacuolar protein sorting-associated protein 33A [Adelges cooleyi]|uniref:vacuolar protein sorting-associated protein 33A n=1 Tax=Adelges cooleyi TaxID=133065 RepID=UPI0021808EDC|nr:vacuolar protein sorting-associated protein 33A [Adelges cooleyi]
MSNYLNGGRVNVGQLQESAAKNLILLLDKCDGPKVIILDEGLTRPIGLIATYSLLREHDVKEVFILNAGKLGSFREKVKNVIFITRPFLTHMDMICENIHKENQEDLKHREYHLFFVPTRSLLCEKRLERKGVFGNFVLIEEFRCFLFPLENDLMSMEMNDCYKELSLEKDPTCLYRVAQAIVMLEDIYGRIGRISGKGPTVKQVWDLVSKISLEPRAPNSKATRNYKTIDHLIILDRSVDLLTPMATQLTFEGLIDELYGIDCCTVELPADKFVSEEGNSNVLSHKKIVLNSSDEIFAETRNKHFNAVLMNLSKRAKHITSEYDETRNGKTVQEMKQLVSKLPYMLTLKKQLSTYTTIAGLIKELTDKKNFREFINLQQELILGIDSDKILPQIEDLIANKHNIISVLRLICMQSSVNSGLKQKVLDYYKKEIIQTYGFEHLVTMANLETSGLIKIQSSSRSYALCRRLLKLDVYEMSEVDPDDINYVYGIYAPLSVRLIQHISKSDSKVLSDVLPILPGPNVEHVNSAIDQTSSMSFLVDSQKVVLVFFIGGCTFAEISALRFLSTLEECTTEYVIATTNITNGNSFIKSLLIPEISKSLIEFDKYIVTVEYYTSIILNMMNIKIIILLSLAAYVSCGLNHSSGREASYMDLELPEASSSANPELEIVAKFQNIQIFGKSDDEIIEDAFNMCNEWAYQDQRWIPKLISIYQFSLYMVEEDEETLETFKNYAISFGSSESSESSWIDLPKFSKVFKDYCIKLDVSVEKFAQERKDAMIFRIRNDNKIINDLYEDCREWVNRDGLSLINISDYQFCNYMINSTYIEDDHYSITNYLKSFKFPGAFASERWIDLPIFSKVFRGYCSKLGVSVKKLAQERKEASILRRQKEMETIRRDEQTRKKERKQ